MAKTTEITRVVGNRGRAFGSLSKSYKRKGSHHASRSNTGGEILAYNLATGNPGARKGTMATTKKKKSYKKPGSKSHYKKNTGKSKSYGGHAHKKKYKRNAGAGVGSIGALVTTGTFAVVGALGSKLGAQLVLGTNNTGVVGYAGNLAAGGVLWFLADKVMKNQSAAHGILIGTVIQVILRAINDYTPFGSYVANLGMGDYQMQSYVTPQILLDPVNSAAINIPNGWGAPALPAPTAMAKTKGVGSLYDDHGGGLY
jgi:hypothetical protein